MDDDWLFFLIFGCWFALGVCVCLVASDGIKWHDLNVQADALCINNGFDERISLEQTSNGAFVQCAKWNLTEDTRIQEYKWFLLK